MVERYNGYCMKFSNEELKDYLYDRFCGNTDLKIRCLSEDDMDIDINSTEKIGGIVFDEKENIFIMFLGVHTSIFAYDTEIMFIDEKSKNAYTSSDVAYNVVYEGNMREMTHKQMLEMFSEIILCFIDAINVSVIQTDVPENKNYKQYKYYKPQMFTVNVENNHTVKQTKIYENIIINY